MVDINGLGETKTSKSPDKQENNNQTKNIAKDGAIAIGKGLFLALATAKIFIDLNEGRQQRDLLALYKIALSKNNSKPKLYEINKNGKNQNKESPSKVKSNIKNPSVKNPQTNSNQVDQQTLESQLFEIAASSKYLANNTQDPEIKAASAEATIRKGSHPNANTIEKDGKSLQFDQDMNVVKNDFSAKEIKELSQNLKKDKEQKMEQNRTKEINRNIGLSI